VTAPAYTRQAAAAIEQAARAEHDFAGWLAAALATAAARLGSSHALIAGRPGSWEAGLIRQLLGGTVGWDDEYLPGYAAPDTATAPPVSGRSEPRPDPAPVVHDVRFFGLLGGQVSAECEPCQWARLLDLGHTLADLQRLVAQHGGAEAGQLAAIRAVLARFDWETGDRQYALEEIERITEGDESR
jgi:hypothetical protein